MTVSALLSTLIFLVVAGLICWLVMWFVDYVGVPEPFRKVIKVIVALIALIILINALLGLVGTPFIRW